MKPEIMRQPKKLLLIILFLFITGLLILWCIPITRYILLQGFHQCRVLLSRRNIADMENDPRTPEKIRERLKLIPEIKKFGHELGLKDSDSYSTYCDTGGQPAVWAVSACPRDSLKPLTWKFPIVGTVPYLGYFKKESALKAREELIARGYDTLTRPVTAYSTIGILPDPLFSSLLTGSEEGLAEVILHEMTHETIWIKNNIELNENIANFTGNTGGIEFLKKRYGPESAQVTNLLNLRHDSDIFSDFMANLYEELDRFYRSDISSAEKIEGREDIFKKYKERFEKQIKPRLKTGNYDYFTRLKLNNAYLLYNRCYHKDGDMFEDLWILQGKDLKRTLSFLKSLNRGDEESGRRFMERVGEEIDRLKAQGSGKK